MTQLSEAGDPRVIGDGDTFDRTPFVDSTFAAPPKKKKAQKF
jgi:hypothetical protein